MREQGEDLWLWLLQGAAISIFLQASTLSASSASASLGNGAVGADDACRTRRTVHCVGVARLFPYGTQREGVHSHAPCCTTTGMTGNRAEPRLHGQGYVTFRTPCATWAKPMMHHIPRAVRKHPRWTGRAG